VRYVLKDINEITDSREILESRPHPFTRIFIYILIAILLSGFIWSYFSEKEIEVKATGIIEPSKSIIEVANEAAGKVTSINFKDGDKVKKGQVIYTIDHSNLDVQKSALEDDLKLQTDEVNNLNKLKQSITDGKNYFDANSSDAKEYYGKYQRYVEGISDINNSANSSQVQIGDLQDQVSKLNLLEKSINDNKNYFNDSSSYNNQYNDYETNVQQYQGKIDDAQNQYNTLNKQKNSMQNQGQNSQQTGTSSGTNEVALQGQIDSAKIAIDSANEDLTKYKDEFMENISSTIEQDQTKIKELQSAPSLSQENGSNYTSVDEYKNDNLSQIENAIKTDQSKIDQDNSNIKSADISIDECTVEAPTDGVINALNQINKGDILQAGTVIANVLPIVDSKYKLQLYIANKDIGNIKKGQDISCNFDALPYSEYGSVNTEIETISADAKVSQSSGTSYYTGEATIPNKPLYDKKGEKAEIKSGMSCQVDIITRKEKMLYYLLEQINLKD
jgi:multidrug resistance efflux pump